MPPDLGFFFIVMKGITRLSLLTLLPFCGIFTLGEGTSPCKPDFFPRAPGTGPGSALGTEVGFISFSALCVRFCLFRKNDSAECFSPLTLLPFCGIFVLAKEHRPVNLISFLARPVVDWVQHLEQKSGLFRLVPYVRIACSALPQCSLS